jgi:hypothetical protein
MTVSWVFPETPRDNTKPKKKGKETGYPLNRWPRGPNKKLSDEAVREIRKGGNMRELAKKYGIRLGYAYMVRSGRTHSHVL